MLNPLEDGNCNTIVDGYGTHGKYLIAAIKWAKRRKLASQTLVLFELGTGGRSSKILQRALRASETVRLVSFESDPTWFENYKRGYGPHPHSTIRDVNNDSEWSKVISEEVGRLEDSDFLVAFIDSSPWQSRVDALEILRDRAEIILIHDVDYFPHHGIFGTEIEQIRVKTRANPRFGTLRLDSSFLGRREYSDVFQEWFEVFPEYGGYYTGPPTLIGSNKEKLQDLVLPRGTILQSSSVSRSSIGSE